jgi:hypothetical protein
MGTINKAYRKSVFKRAQSAYKKYAPVGAAYSGVRKILNPEKKDTDSTAEAAEAERQRGLGELAGEEAGFQKIGEEALAGATEEAKTAGTYAETPAAKSALQSESDARARGLKHASRGRANVLRQRLGLPATP